jgi:hypothetical protein
MPTKRIVILANSVKKNDHCIAGKEVIIQNGKISYGQWIRPVSEHGDEGALSASQCSLTGGNNPAIWDVVDVSLLRPEAYAPQPENWIIDESKPWRKVVLNDLPAIAMDAPPNLWIDQTQKNDRVHPANLGKLKQVASLYLIRPKNLRLRVGWDSFQGEPPKHKRRAYFEYQGEPYDLGLTDPAIEQKYCSPYPAKDAGMPLVPLKDPADCVLCISLTRPFSFTGCHHKVVATVIE